MINPEQSENEETRIIVDEDWKSQVEKEKEKLREQQDSNGDAQDNQAGARGMPPASFPVLVSTLATQVMGTLGMFADPQSGQAYVDPMAAKHLIELMAVLQEKTAGNLTAEESQMLEQALHELRLIYVEVTKQLVAAGHQIDSAAPTQPAAPKKPIIELP